MHSALAMLAAQSASEKPIAIDQEQREAREVTQSLADSVRIPRMKCLKQVRREAAVHTGVQPPAPAGGGAASPVQHEEFLLSYA